MPTSSTREGAAAMTNESNEHSLVVKPLGWLESVRQFWRDVAREMKQVSWPTRTEVVNTTLVVIIAVFFFAFYLFAADIIFSYLIKGIEWAAGKVF
ncbi:MAG: preprotein translocase subunit SecE [Blastocatellia bacterium]